MNKEKCFIDCYYNVGNMCKFHDFQPCGEPMECISEEIEEMDELEETCVELFEGEDFLKSIENEENNNQATTTIEDLMYKGLSVRAYNVLTRQGINTLDELKELSIEKLKTFRHMGKRTLEDIIEVLKGEGVELEGSIDDQPKEEIKKECYVVKIQSINEFHYYQLIKTRDVFRRLNRILKRDGVGEILGFKKITNEQYEEYLDIDDLEGVF